MGFDFFPSQSELVRFFAAEPEVFGDTVITYKHQSATETLYCSFSPDYGDLDLTLLHHDHKKAVLSLSHIQRVDLVADGTTAHLKVTFHSAMPLREFLLSVQPEVTFIWGTTLDKG
jgi:hypothetical protein